MPFGIKSKVKQLKVDAGCTSLTYYPGQPSGSCSFTSGSCCGAGGSVGRNAARQAAADMKNLRNRFGMFKKLVK